MHTPHVSILMAYFRFLKCIPFRMGKCCSISCPQFAFVAVRVRVRVRALCIDTFSQLILPSSLRIYFRTWNAVTNERQTILWNLNNKNRDYVGGWRIVQMRTKCICVWRCVNREVKCWPSSAAVVHALGNVDRVLCTQKPCSHESSISLITWFTFIIHFVWN